MDCLNGRELCLFVFADKNQELGFNREHSPGEGKKKQVSSFMFAMRALFRPRQISPRSPEELCSSIGWAFGSSIRFSFRFFKKFGSSKIEVDRFQEISGTEDFGSVSVLTKLTEIC